MQGKIKRFVILLILPVIFIAITLSVFLHFHKARRPTRQDLVQDVVEYAKSHEFLTFGDVTGFEWDIAIRDSSFYATGKLVMEDYGYEYETQQMLDDGERRWIFFEDGEMVYECTYVAGSGFNFAGDRYPSEEVVKSFSPDTLFYVKWEDNRDYPVLYLAE